MHWLRNNLRQPAVIVAGLALALAAGIMAYVGIRRHLESEAWQRRYQASAGLQVMWGNIDSCCYGRFAESLATRDLQFTTEELVRACPCVGQNFEEGSSFVFLCRNANPGRPAKWIEELGTDIVLEQLFVRRGSGSEVAGILGHSPSSHSSYLLLKDDTGWYVAGGAPRRRVTCDRFEVPVWVQDVVNGR